MGGFHSDIESKNRPPEVGRAVARLAARQHGVVTAAQLMSIGLSRGAIQSRIGAGRLHVVHRGIYSVGHELLSREGRYLAAVLACGPQAALSHRSAADLWGIRCCASRIEVTASRSRKGRMGIVVHRSRVIEPRDFTVNTRIRTTNPSRTLLDLAAVLAPVELARAVDRAERLELFDGQAIEELLGRCTGHAGVRRLRSAIMGWRPTHTRSELEDRFQGLLRAAGIEAPLINVSLTGRQGIHEVDCHWPATELIVQLDGFAYHRTRRDRERDASTDADLELAGYRMVRLTWNDVVMHGERTVKRVRRLLARPGITMERKHPEGWQSGRMRRS